MITQGEKIRARIRRYGGDFAADVSLAIRHLRRSPAHGAVVVGTLAIGLGANFTLIGAFDEVMLRPPEQVSDPDKLTRLLLVGQTPTGTSAIGGANYPLLLDMQRDATAFSAVAGFTTRRLSLGIGREAVVVQAGIVSANYLQMLGARAALGRIFDTSDGFSEGQSVGGPPLAVLSHSFWSRYFGRDSSVINRAVRIGGLMYTIVGVMPRGFKGIDRAAPDVWLPIVTAAADPEVRIDLTDRVRYSLSLVGRFKPGTRQAAAEREAAAIWSRFDVAPSGVANIQRVVAASAILGRGPDAPREVQVTAWLTGLSVVVLLIACVNVANLLLGRTLARQHEIATRRALGADRNRIIRQVLAEGIWYSLLGAAGGMVVASIGRGLLTRVLGYETPAAFDGVLLICATIATAGTGAIISLVPAMVASREGRASALKVARASGHGITGVRMGLVAAQTGLCFVMLVAAALFSVSFRRVATLDLGVDAAHTLRAIVNLDQLAVSSDEVEATYAEMLRRVREIPGVDGVSLAGSDPYQAGRAVSAHTLAHDAAFYWPRGGTRVAIEAPVGDGFFRAVGAELRGRDFSAADDRGAPRVAIVNGPMAAILFPEQDPLNQCIILPSRANDRDTPCATVVGVLPGVWYSSILNRDKPMVYVPLTQRTAYYGFWRPQGVFVHVRGAPDMVVDQVRRALQGVRSDLPAVQVTMMRDAVAAETRPWQAGATIFSLFGIVALIVGLAGVYGTVAFVVRQRSYDTAVRLALGAGTGHVVSSLAGTTLTAVVSGLVAGGAAAMAARRWVGPLLFRTAPGDMRIIGGLAAALLGIAVVAAIAPAWRAKRLDVAALLRSS